MSDLFSGEHSLHTVLDRVGAVEVAGMLQSILAEAAKTEPDGRKRVQYRYASQVFERAYRELVNYRTAQNERIIHARE